MRKTLFLIIFILAGFFVCQKIFGAEIHFGLGPLAKASVEAWFQTEGGDVHAQGSINDPIPATATEPYCSLRGDGGYPGVVSYYTGNASFGEGSVSEENWLANSIGRANGYSYFYSLLGSPTENWNGNVGDFPSNPGTGETEIIYTTSPAHLPALNIPPGRKVIVLTSSNAIIENNISVSSGGFLAVIAAQNINIDDSVAEIGGVYIADGHLSTGEGTVPFSGEGMFYGQGGIRLDRDLGDGNKTLPAEQFIFRPDLWINAPQELWKASYTWQELAP